MLRLKALSSPLMAVLVAGFALGDEGIPNWSAPATWSPHRGSRGVSAMGAITSPLPFIGVTPCRVADTRGNGFTGQYGPPALVANATRSFTIAGQCGIPATAAAVSFNFGALDVAGAGDLRVFPAGGAVPLVSTLNYSASTPNIANAAVVSLGTGGAITVQADAVPLDLIIDVNGYYAPAGVGTGNTFLGLNAGNFTMTGDGNTGFGANALGGNTTGHGNTASGFNVLQQNTTGNDNTAFGANALFANTSGGGNTATGASALLHNFTGGSNTATGGTALFNNDSGFGNTAMGINAIWSNTAGDYNTAIGANTLQNTTGSGNIGIGPNGGVNLTTGNDNIDIGNAGVAGESAAIRIGIGGTQTRAFLAGVRGATTGVNDAVAVMIDSAGQLGTVSSSRRVKRDIEDMGEASQGLMKLRPVTFRYDASLDPTGSRQYGLVAEEVAEAFPDLAVFDTSCQPETVRYHVLVPMLLNEVQRDRKTITDLRARLERLEALMSESAR